MVDKSMPFFEKKLFKRHRASQILKHREIFKSNSYISVKDAQRNLLNSLSKNNDEYIMRQYSKIKTQDFGTYIKTVENSLNKYLMDYNPKKDIKSMSQNPCISLKDKMLIKKAQNLNRNYFFNHALTPRTEDSNLKININGKQYPSPFQSLEVIKHNNLIFDDVNKKFLNRQGNLFKLKILNIKKYYNKYKIKMPKMHISNSMRIPLEIPLVDLTEDKDKKGNRGMKIMINDQKKNGEVQLYAYYRYPNKNFPGGREQFSLFFSNNTNKIYICGGLKVNMNRNSIWCLNMEKLEWNKVQQNEFTNNRFGHTANIHQNKIYIFGGRAKTDKGLSYPGLEIFSLNDGIYYRPLLSKLNCPLHRRNHISILIDEQIFIHGGVTENNEILNDCHILNLNPLKWMKVNIINKFASPKLYGYSACVVVPKQYAISPKFNIYNYPDIEVVNCRIKKKGLYIFGGKSKEEGGITNKLWNLSLGEKYLEWTSIETKGKPPRPRYNHSMNFYEKENFLIIHGGRNDLMSETFAFDDTFVLDLEFFEWFHVQLFSQFDQFKVLSRCGHQSVVYGNKLIIFGGMNNNNYIGSSLFIINLDFSYMNQMRTAQEYMMKELKGQKLKNQMKKSQIGLVTKFSLPSIK